MSSLGIAIITLNEEKHIEKAILSVIDIADKIVIVDSGSTDNTKTIAEKFNVSFYEQKWLGYSKQKQLAVDYCKTEWVLVLDADEFLSTECAQEIKRVVQNTEYSGFEIPRLLHFFGKYIYFGKGIDYPLRLFKTKQAHFDNREVHERLHVAGKVGRLKSFVYHHSADTFKDRLSKIERDSNLELKYYRPENSSYFKMISYPFRYFFYIYIKKQGFRDGFAGLILTLLFSYQIFRQEFKYKYWK